MSNDTWKTHVLKAIDEAYDGTGGIYLDENTNVIAELKALNGTQASTVLPGAGNSVANQVKHLLTTVAAHEAQFRGGEFPDLDWGGDWADTQLSDNEWQALVREFELTHAKLKSWISEPSVDEEEAYIGAAVMAAAHHAYHAGQIRHAAAYASQK